MFTRLARLVVLVPLLFLTGCTPDNKGKIEGTKWRSEAANVRAKNTNPLSGATVYLPAGFMELDFHKDGSLFYIIAGKLHSGKYSLGMGSVVVLHLDEPVAGLKTHSERITIENRRLTMTDTDGTQLTFQRQN
jgi:hypothetical protein